MKKEFPKGLLFRSEDLCIVSQENFFSENFAKSVMIEGESSFNLLFLLSSGVQMEAEDCGTRFLFKKNQYILHYSDRESRAALWTEHREQLNYFHIRISYDFIFRLISPALNRENADILEAMTCNHYIFLHKQTPPFMTVEMHIILKEIISSSKKGVLQKLFVEAKVIKLLILILEQFGNKNRAAETPEIPSKIKKYIDENFHRNIRAEEIGKNIGINQTTVRKAFKAEYQTTVSDYMAELRMLKAKKLIVDQKIMIKEIAIECGYEYVQNFTRAFKKKFGVSPERLRNSG